jgi:hypothetical protein
LTFRCDSQRDRGQKRPGPPSVFDGTWEGKMNDLPGVNLIVADAGGGQIGGVITFYFQTREDGGNWQVRGKSVAPMLAAHTQDKALIFEVQHHKNHGSAEFGPDVTFRMELTGENKAMLSNISEPSTAPVKILRRE